MKLSEVLLVMAGASLGGGLRYVLGTWIETRTGDFPWHTLVINLSGAFLLGVLMAYTSQRGLASNLPRLFLGIGLLGGYTTFSTLAYETVALAEEGRLFVATVNMAGSGVLGVAAAWLGILAGRAL